MVFAPNRDFSRWKVDSRTYAAEYDTDAICIESLDGTAIQSIYRHAIKSIS